MESHDYARLRTYVEEVIYKWQEAKVRPSKSNPDTDVNRLIAEREERHVVRIISVRARRSSSDSSMKRSVLEEPHRLQATQPTNSSP